MSGLPCYFNSDKRADGARQQRMSPFGTSATCWSEPICPIVGSDQKSRVGSQSDGPIASCARTIRREGFDTRKLRAKMVRRLLVLWQLPDLARNRHRRAVAASRCCGINGLSSDAARGLKMICDIRPDRFLRGAVWHFSLAARSQRARLFGLQKAWSS
jgi:hypothetical protein